MIYYVITLYYIIYCYNYMIRRPAPAAALPYVKLVSTGPGKRDRPVRSQHWPARAVGRVALVCPAAPLLVACPACPPSPACA